MNNNSKPSGIRTGSEIRNNPGSRQGGPSTTSTTSTKNPPSGR
ncbi:hypothetical protein [uncultured Clostridium sp.]|nr:hypothetical protein [uncultured Clostridium sp.]